MAQGITGPINYRCPQCLFRAVDYDLLFDEEQEQYYCRRCNWEGEEIEILGFYSVYKKQYKHMLKRWTVEQIEAKDEEKECDEETLVSITLDTTSDLGNAETEVIEV